MERLLQSCRIQSQLVRECLAEFLGLYIAVLIGSGAAAQVITSQGTHGSYLTMQLGSALGTVTHDVCFLSGAQLNVVWSMSLWLLGRQPWRKVPLYALSHLLGAFLGAATVYLQYYGKISTVFISFLSFPLMNMYIAFTFFVVVVATALLLICCLAVEDRRQGLLPDGLAPVLVGALILTIGLSMGSNCGFPLNPARDLGPRLFTFIAGWGEEVFKAGGGWWWVPIVAPFVGGLLGTLIYELLIEVHHQLTEGDVHNGPWKKTGTRTIPLFHSSSLF
uniref:Aquaporin 10b n=1 Tax=Sphaeramia orbicularis TaxID=375764 RepID=A0A672ZJL8_9TELE